MANPIFCHFAFTTRSKTFKIFCYYIHTFAQPILQQEMEISLDTTMKSNAPIKSLHEMGFSMVEVRKQATCTYREVA